MKSKILWFTCGCLFVCSLGAIHAKFKSVACEQLAADNFVMVGETSVLATTKEHSSLTMVSPDGKTIATFVVGNNQALIKVVSPNGSKVTNLSN